MLAPNLKLLLLDEPTHNLDKNSIELLKNALRGSLNEFVNQIILITHEETLQEAANGKLYKVERDKNVDGESRVIEIK